MYTAEAIARGCPSQPLPRPVTEPVNAWPPMPGFSESMLKRLVQPMVRSPQLEGFLARLMAAPNGTNFSVAAIGGSMTAGQGCLPTARFAKGPVSPHMVHERRCAWPARLQAWFQLAFTGRTVTVINIGKPAWGTNMWALDGLEDRQDIKSVDLVITDLAINAGMDGGVSQTEEEEAAAAVWSVLTSMPTQPGVLALEVAEGLFTRNSFDYDEKWTRTVCKPASEQVLFGEGEAQHYDTVISNRSVFRVCRRKWWPAVWHQSVARRLHLPVVSLHDALWPALEEPDPNFPLLWDGHMHPSNSTHQVIANSVAFALAHATERLCTAGGVPLSWQAWNQARDLARTNVVDRNNDSKAALRRCAPARTRLHEPLEAFQPAAPPRGWFYGEDVAGNVKPGWLANSNATAKDLAPRIEFNVTVGDQRLLLIGYLSSYDLTMGGVNVQLVAEHGETVCSWTIDAHWSNPVSVVTYKTFELPSIVNPGSYQVRLHLLPSKWRHGDERVHGISFLAVYNHAMSRFKLLHIVTC